MPIQRLGLVGRLIVARKPPLVQIGLAVGGVVLATAVRWPIDRGATGVPFATYAPVILLAANFLNWPYALITVVGSLAAGSWFYSQPWYLDPGWGHLALLAVYAVATGLAIVVGHKLQVTVLALQQQSEEFQSYNQELQHRAKNALQIVRALAARASRTSSPADFYDSLSGRLDALVKANELLGAGLTDRCGLRDLVDGAIRPFSARQFTLSGPDCTVGHRVGTPLVMGFHELCTNAHKYGALSTDEGRVTIDWTLEEQGRKIAIVWQERGGPAVQPPQRSGIGTRLLTRHGAFETATIAYEPGGVVCRIRVAAEV